MAKWTDEQRAKFQKTMALKMKARKAVKQGTMEIPLHAVPGGKPKKQKTGKAVCAANGKPTRIPNDRLEIVLELIRLVDRLI
jgi:hypothetical protein